MSQGTPGKFVDTHLNAPLIVVEGIDGAGKTTVVEKMTSRLEEMGYSPFQSFEPSDGPCGQEIRRRFESQEDTVAISDFFLFMADRAEHNKEVVEPKLTHGRPVILDRYLDSTYAYQPQAMRDEVDNPRNLIEHCHSVYDLEADITLYLDIDIDTALERLNDMKGEESRDNYEQREFLENVRANYEGVMGTRRDAERIDATQSPEDVLNDCLEAVDPYFGGRFDEQ